jgi:hypothetical protein
LMPGPFERSGPMSRMVSTSRRDRMRRAPHWVHLSFGLPELSKRDR